MSSYEVIEGDAESGVVLHVPHSAVLIPSDVRGRILLDDAALAGELRLMTDHATDTIASRVQELVAVRPWAFVNRLSRLVIDPERFPDDREIMEKVGMGAVYTRTHDGQPLRASDQEHEQDLLDRYFDPYASALTDVVAARLAAAGRVLIVDVHSYPTLEQPFELVRGDRPPVCVGVDAFHTRGWLADPAAMSALLGYPALVNNPFAGTYVPLAFYGADPRVSSVMIEIRRDQYLDEATAEPWAAQIEALARGIARVIDHWQTT